MLIALSYCLQVQNYTTGKINYCQDAKHEFSNLQAWIADLQALTLGLVL